jgi:hypothetical protein
MVIKKEKTAILKELEVSFLTPRNHSNTNTSKMLFKMSMLFLVAIQACRQDPLMLSMLLSLLPTGSSVGSICTSGERLNLPFPVYE